jgi:hypothetical protein
VSAAPLELTVLFDDVLAVTRTARSATRGWRAICVRARRTLGSEVVAPVADLDLDEDVGRVAPIVARLVWGAPSVVDTLVFELFDGVEVDVAGPSGTPPCTFTGFRLAGAEGFDPGSRWLRETPVWQPQGGHLPSRALDALGAAVTRARLAKKLAVAHALRFGAAALLARFAGAAHPHRLVVAYEAGEAHAVREGLGAQSSAPAPTFAQGPVA